MRNAHEALRASLKLLEKTLDGPSVEREHFYSLWESFLRSMRAHMNIEDTDVFKLLDESSNGEITNDGLFSVHFTDEEFLNHVVQTSLPKEGSSASDEDWAKFKEQWMSWKEMHEHHLVAEEKIMMPLTQKTGETPEERSLVVHHRIIIPAMERIPEDFIFHLCFCVEYLSKYGSSNQNAFTATSVYVRGLKAACNEEQWKQFCPKLKQSCVSEIWNEMNSQFVIEAPKEGLIDTKLAPSRLALANVLPKSSPFHSPTGTNAEKPMCKWFIRFLFCKLF
jgi:hypothetical protein